MEFSCRCHSTTGGITSLMCLPFGLWAPDNIDVIVQVGVDCDVGGGVSSIESALWCGVNANYRHIFELDLRWILYRNTIADRQDPGTYRLAMSSGLVRPLNQ